MSGMTGAYLPLAGGTMQGPITLSNGVALANLPFTKAPSQSADNAITFGGLITFAHGLGVDPKLVVVDLVCQIAQGGWTVGQVLTIASKANNDGGNSDGVQVQHDAATVRVQLGANTLHFLSTPAGVDTNITTANWKLRITVYA